MAGDYWIDYDDPPYPQIRHRSHRKFDPQFHDLMSLSKARKDIKEKCRQERQHWLSVMNHQVDQSPEAIIQDAKESRSA